MRQVLIPVDLRNPGQVFACLGLIEATHELVGMAEGGFSWERHHDPYARFSLVGAGDVNPLNSVLTFLATAKASAIAPHEWKPSNAKHAIDVERVYYSPDRISALSHMALPIALSCKDKRTILGHWIDGSDRDEFKLYAGNRSALKIARDMMESIAELWDSHKEALLSDPLGKTVPMRGSFNFDARCAWQAIDLGYSPNEHRQSVVGSPVVELLAAWGLEHARPRRTEERRTYCYAVWEDLLPPMLARPALAGETGDFNRRQFRLRIGLSGRNKVVGYADEETR